MHASRRLLVALVLMGACAVAVAGTANGTSASRTTGWAIRDLGTLGGNTSAATAINNRGQLVGWSTTRSGARHAFLWEDGRMRDLGTLGGRQSGALALNERGQIVGWSMRRDGRKQATLWQQGTIRGLREPGSAGSVATGINEQGDVSGYWWRERDDDSAYDARHCRGPGGTCGFGGLWSKGVFGRFGSIGSFANAVNDESVVVGSNSVFHDLPGRTMLWREGGNHFTWFQDAPGVGYGVGPASRNAPALPWPAVVGWTLSKGRRQASLWYGDYREPPVILGTLGGPTSVAYGINSRSQIVGESSTKGGGAHAFVWRKGTMRDLGTLPGGHGSSAAGTDDRGRIVGRSGTRGGHVHAVLWTQASKSP